MLARYGARVTIVEASDRLLAREDPSVSRRLAAALAADGIDVRVGAEATEVARPAGRTCRVTLEGGDVVEGEELIVAAGRRPRTDDLGVDAAGIELDDSGAIPVDKRCRAAKGVWAVGDVTGVAAFTHVAKYQGRIAVADIAGEKVGADYRAIPRVVFSDPEVAAVGLTEAQARERDIDLVTTELDIGSIARTETYGEELEGELRLLADRGAGALVGAWAVGPLASEFIHLPVLAIRAQVPVAVLRDTVPQFPTFSEGWQKALEALEL
jgi:dihydrolipoamide dehydrogenase